MQQIRTRIKPNRDAASSSPIEWTPSWLYKLKKLHRTQKQIKTLKSSSKKAWITPTAKESYFEHKRPRDFCFLL